MVARIFSTTTDRGRLGRRLKIIAHSIIISDNIHRAAIVFLQLLLLVECFKRLVITSNSSRSELGDIWAPMGDGRAPMPGALQGSTGRESSKGAICNASWVVVLLWVALRLGDFQGSAATGGLFNHGSTGLLEAIHASEGAPEGPAWWPLEGSGGWPVEPFCSHADSADDPDEGDWVRESQLSTLAVPAGRAPEVVAAAAPPACHGSIGGEADWP